MPRIGSASLVVVLAALLSGGAGMLWARSPVPPSLEATGFSGNAGEWELTANLSRDGDTRELAGPMKLTHIGWCSKEGPQVKEGRLRLRMARLSSGIEATVHFDGVDCTFAASLSDAYVGNMVCPGRRPVQLLLWLR